MLNTFLLELLKNWRASLGMKLSMIYAIGVQYAICMLYVYTPYICSKNICIHTYMYVNKWVHWMGWAKQDLPTREEIAVDCSSRTEGSTLESVEKEAPGRGIRRNYIHFRRERPTSYYPSDPMPCMLSETRRVAPGRAGCVFLRIGWVYVGSRRQQQTCCLFLSWRTWKMRDWLEWCSVRAREIGILGALRDHHHSWPPWMTRILPMLAKTSVLEAPSNRAAYWVITRRLWE